MAGRLEGKVAVITGASRGLGQFCAVAYAKEGAKVAVAARTEEVRDERLPGTIYETARLVEEAGGQALPVVCNVADIDSIDAMTRKVLDEYGQIDVLMTNAAIMPPGQISTMQPRHWELEFRVNVHGAFHCIRSVLPSMQERRGGNIINVSSRAALGGSHYGASKRAIEAMTIGLAAELRDLGIAVNCLRPVSWIPTAGSLFAGGTGGRRVEDGTPPDSYIEAAVLLAMQTPDSCTGGVYSDAQALKVLADAATFERFKAMNPPEWSLPQTPMTDPRAVL
jgi:NAD(P)-dependent dehydrogenase (short-subunit alcohol dehydrogenase family)